MPSVLETLYPAACRRPSTPRPRVLWPPAALLFATLPLLGCPVPSSLSCQSGPRYGTTCVHPGGVVATPGNGAASAFQNDPAPPLRRP